MKDLLDKLFSLGIGIAVVSKEQMEKLIDELVEKGKMTRSESREVIEELINKGKESQNKMEEAFQRKLEETSKKFPFVTKTELDELQKRIDALEEKLNNLTKEN